MQVVEILQALLTPVIAGVTVYIAYAQYRTNRNRFKLELFEKRYGVYAGVQKFIERAVGSGSVSNSAFADLAIDTRDAFFLFGDEVDQYVSLLREKGARLRFLTEELSSSLPVGEKRSDFAAEDAELFTWFGHQFSESKQIFKRYLRLGD